MSVVDVVAILSLISFVGGGLLTVLFAHGRKLARIEAHTEDIKTRINQNGGGVPARCIVHSERLDEIEHHVVGIKKKMA